MSDAERIAQLIAALRDDNDALREHAMASLGQMGHEAIPQLIGLMADEDVVIREAAANCGAAHRPSCLRSTAGCVA